MSDEEDDYLSEKLLAGIVAQSSSGSKTYFQRRREAQLQSEIRNLAGRTKSKKEIERENLETLKEGMGTSLFEREKLGEAGGPSKAMNMMTKMGFKPGQTLGKQQGTTSSTESGDTLSKKSDQNTPGLKAPIIVNIWEGKSLMSQESRHLTRDH
jgi:hydroxylamine reductase (hybrid-cluster protein)